MEYQSPVAVIIESKVEGNKLKTVLQLDEVSSPPLAPGGLWSIDKPGRLVIELHRVIHRQENIITFETYDIAENPLRPGDKYNFISWWAPAQLEIAQSDPTKWHKEEFKPKDMLLFRQQDGSTIGRKLVENEKSGDGFVDSGGWNHAHCKLCWETISTHEGYKHFGYTDGSDWVCQDCYEKYIQSCFGKKLGEAY